MMTSYIRINLLILPISGVPQLGLSGHVVEKIIGWLFDSAVSIMPKPMEISQLFLSDPLSFFGNPELSVLNFLRVHWLEAQF